MPNQIIDNSAFVLAQISAALTQALDRTGKTMVQNVQDEMNASKSGHNYDGHIASAAGESVANWHDKLIQTAKHVPTGPMLEEVSLGDDATAYFADLLEKGSIDGKIAPRPTMQPLADASHGLLIENVTRAVQEATK